MTAAATDVAVEDIPVLRPWLRALLHSRLYPLLAAAFPKLADGTTTVDSATGCVCMQLLKRNHRAIAG